MRRVLKESNTQFLHDQYSYSKKYRAELPCFRFINHAKAHLFELCD
jgi:hypothetical protein